MPLENWHRLDINLDFVPKKYEGWTERSWQFLIPGRMAVVLAAEDAETL